MFDKLKQINQLKKMQEKMKEERVEIAQGGLRVVVNGNFEVEEITLNEKLDPKEQARLLKDCLNRAIRDVQVKIAQDFSRLVE